MINTSIVTMNSLASPEECLIKISQLRGKIDVYSWFEGPQGMPASGALFLRDKIFKPLLSCNPDAKLNLYSLKGWDFNNPKGAVSKLADAIYRLDHISLRCLTASSFFNYADENGPIQEYLSSRLLSKTWLLEISKGHKLKGVKASQIFKGALFTQIGSLDLTHCYAFLQYVEAYYLIQRSIRERKQDVSVVFILPNDESKYYQDYPEELEKMLKIEFGDDLQRLAIRIHFLFFKYGDDIKDRPYIDKSRRPEKLKAEDMASFFNFLNIRTSI